MVELNKMGVSIRHTQLEMVKSHITTTLFKSNHFSTCRKDAMKEIQERIFEVMGLKGTSFKLTPGYQNHLPPILHIDMSKTIKQDIILVKTKKKK